jgi:hypothetical protein
MSKIFNKDGSFKNPNRHRVRFYSKIFKQYYSVWICGTPGTLSHSIRCKSDIMLTDVLTHARIYGPRPKPIPQEILNQLKDENYLSWEVIMN